ncbi:MAG: NlpC/P60 family protein [Deltaproteobacteria bacterium]|nr:NlpC/P60 family protein [Deltaproteobacteria bacterium]
MKNRIILGGLVALALILTPGLAFSVPTKGVKKKKTPSTKITSKSAKKSSSKYKSRRYSRPRQIEGRGTVVPAQLLRSSGSRNSTTVTSPTPRYVDSGVAETKPLMRVIPQRDGRFLLEPLKPKKPEAPATRPRSGSSGSPDQSSAPPSYHKFEPWNFSDLILTRARGYTGTPYRRGGNLDTGSATDCSGFTKYIYQGFLIDLPRSSSEQAHVGQAVAYSMDFSKMLPGDLLFFRRGGRSVGHAGIYLGEGKMIHASNRRTGVIVTDLRQGYYQNTFVVAKRVFEVKYPK